MSVNTETASAQGQTTVLEKEGVYASLFEKINLTPASSLGDINAFLDDAALSDAPAGERLTAAMQVFMDCIRKSGQKGNVSGGKRITVRACPADGAGTAPAAVYEFLPLLPAAGTEPAGDAGARQRLAGAAGASAFSPASGDGVSVR